MEFITENRIEYILISTKSQLEELLVRISKKQLFAQKFKFLKRELFIYLLESLDITIQEFEEKYFYYDHLRKLHISASEFDYIWISTSGLVPTSKPTTNKAVNSCLSQYLVISLLFKEAIDLSKNESVYNVDSYESTRLGELSTAIFHNMTFYIEVFCKAYLSLANMESPHSHSLSLLYSKTVDTMINNKHDNSLFQILVLDPLYNFVDHIGTIPGNFKEHFIKYDDNPLDDTVILFDSIGLIEMTLILELSIDFITSYYYEGTKTYYLESNVYQRMLHRAKTDEKKKKIQKMYPHLVPK